MEIDLKTTRIIFLPGAGQDVLPCGAAKAAWCHNPRRYLNGTMPLVRSFRPARARVAGSRCVRQVLPWVRYQKSPVPASA
jgi:hypothetical protein